VGRKAAIDDGAAMATEKQSIEDNLTELNQDYNKAKAHIKALTSEISAIEQEIKNIEESDLIKEFEEQENNRKNLVRNTFTNKSRVAPLIKDTNEGLDKVVSDFTDDTNLFVEDIKQEIGFNDQADNVLQDVIENFKNDGILTARQALNLARESLFNIKLNNIESKIKAACEKGFTSVRLTSKQISATQVVALNSLGYKISHYAIPQPGDTPDLMGIIVEWGIIDK
jgi:chromosome segregation ATPase